MKTKEELNALKEEIETLNKKLADLSKLFLRQLRELFVKRFDFFFQGVQFFFCFHLFFEAAVCGRCEDFRCLNFYKAGRKLTQK